MTMQTETKLIATEKMSVKEIRKNGNTAQKYAVGIFDADDNGILEGNEVSLFNNCQFSYDKNNGQLRIYDNQIRKNGKGGQIVINPYTHEHGVDRSLNVGCETGYYFEDVIKGDMESYGNYKYKQDLFGNRLFYNIGASRGPYILSSFDKIEVTPDYQIGNDKISTKGISEPFVHRLSKGIKKGIEKCAKYCYEHSREYEIQQMKDQNNPNLGGFCSY